MKDKILSYLGFARKSRALTAGFDACRIGMEQGKVVLLLLAEDLSPSTIKECRWAAERCGVPVYCHGTIESLSGACGLDNKGIFGLSDVNLAAGVRKELEKEVRS